jgi:hypothetical protein
MSWGVTNAFTGSFAAASTFWTNSILPHIPAVVEENAKSAMGYVQQQNPSIVFPVAGLLCIPGQINIIIKCFESRADMSAGAAIALTATVGALVFTHDIKDVAVLTIGAYLTGKTIQVITTAACNVAGSIVGSIRECCGQTTVNCQHCYSKIDTRTGEVVKKKNE